VIFRESVLPACFTASRKITAALEDLKTPVKGVIATWSKPYAKWDPANVETHEAFRRPQVVMGKVQDGRVVFANPADRERLKAQAAK
jgi:branched-chain amino acid transport system substrate-binding protein